MHKLFIYATNTDTMSGTIRDIWGKTVSDSHIPKSLQIWNLTGNSQENGQLQNHMTSVWHEKYRAIGEHTYEQQK